MQLSMRKTYFLLGFFFGPAEFVNAQRIFSDEQPVRLDENSVGFQPRTLWGVDLVARAPVSFLIKAQERVIQGDPHFAVRTIDPHRREDAFQRRGIVAAVVPAGLLARSSRGRPGVKRRTLNVLPTVPPRRRRARISSGRSA